MVMGSSIFSKLEFDDELLEFNVVIFQGIDNMQFTHIIYASMDIMNHGDRQSE
jgi:hypothetical protein